MTDSGKSNASVKVTPEILIRLVAGVTIAFGGAWVGGQVTGVDMWTFMDENSFLFYCCVAGLGAFLINPAIRRQREGGNRQ